jgi:hypothetical protein
MKRLTQSLILCLLFLFIGGISFGQQTTVVPSLIIETVKKDTISTKALVINPTTGKVGYNTYGAGGTPTVPTLSQVLTAGNTAVLKTINLSDSYYNSILSGTGIQALKYQDGVGYVTNVTPNSIQGGNSTVGGSSYYRNEIDFTRGIPGDIKFTFPQNAVGSINVFATENYVDNHTPDLSNYVTLDTPQTITTNKLLENSSTEGVTSLAVRSLGNGNGISSQVNNAVAVYAQSNGGNNTIQAYNSSSGGNAGAFTATGGLAGTFANTSYSTYTPIVAMTQYGTGPGLTISLPISNSNDYIRTAGGSGSLIDAFKVAYNGDAYTRGVRLARIDEIPDPSGFVTLDTEQTITARKDFTVVDTAAAAFHNDSSSDATALFQNFGSGIGVNINTANGLGLVINSPNNTATEMHNNSGYTTAVFINSGNGQAGYFEAQDAVGVQCVSNTGVGGVFQSTDGPGGDFSSVNGIGGNFNSEANYAINATNNSPSYAAARIENTGEGIAGRFSSQSGTALYAEANTGHLIEAVGGGNFVVHNSGQSENSVGDDYAINASNYSDSNTTALFQNGGLGDTITANAVGGTAGWFSSIDGEAIRANSENDFAGYFESANGLGLKVSGVYGAEISGTTGGALVANNDSDTLPTVNIYNDGDNKGVLVSSQSGTAGFFESASGHAIEASNNSASYTTARFENTGEGGSALEAYANVGTAGWFSSTLGDAINAQNGKFKVDNSGALIINTTDLAFNATTPSGTVTLLEGEYVEVRVSDSSTYSNALFINPDGLELSSVDTVGSTNSRLFVNKDGNIELDANGGIATYNGNEIAVVDSPDFTGTPTVPTATVGTNTDQAASCAFVLANAGGGASYLVYTALISQSGTSAPTATVLENTLGGTVTWSYNSTGSYQGTLSAGAFTTNKTAFYITPSVNSSQFTFQAVTTTQCQIIAQNNFTGVPSVANNQLSNTTVEIRVYP